MAKFLSDTKYAVRGRLVAIDDSGMVGPMITFRVPPSTSDPQRPGSYIDFVLLDTNRKTLQKRVHVGDELEVILHAATSGVSAGTRNEMTFQTHPRNQCQRISHCRRLFESVTPVNGKVIDNDEHHQVVVDAGVPIVATLLEHKPSKTKAIKVNAWVMFWPTPPTHGIIVGKL
ncbi:MAG TPA: hypothetical protein VNA25_00870 [Phycisphaerae bacterium]|nr:hypothetical protein [Phycisphaerae bacterium]HUT56406.1 hypothetical protein [Phycisphaerae bacterium]